MTQRQFLAHTTQDEASCSKPRIASNSPWGMQFARLQGAHRQGRPLGYLAPNSNFQVVGQSLLSMLVLVEHFV